MKLLLDANLSWRIIKLLQGCFDEVLHVNRCGLLQPVPDEKIWQFAKNNDFIIVTRDSDFIRLSEVRGAPPNVVIIRHKNKSWRFYGELLLTRSSKIKEALGEDNISIVELI